MKKQKYTYAVSAYNFKTGMNEIQPITFTTKFGADYYANRIRELGAKNVRVLKDEHV